MSRTNLKHRRHHHPPHRLAAVAVVGQQSIIVHKMVSQKNRDLRMNKN